MMQVAAVQWGKLNFPYPFADQKSHKEKGEHLSSFYR